MSDTYTLDVIDEMRKMYYGRLVEMVSEVDVHDDTGNIMISPGLKVRHKKSQFEYTVDGVIEDPDTGEIQVVLNNPEEPRFDPTVAVDSGDEVLTGVTKASAQINEQEPMVNTRYVSTHGRTDELRDGLVVPQEEFEKEYEVR